MFKIFTRLTAHWLRKNLGKSSFFETFKNFQNIAAEGLGYGNDVSIENAEFHLIKALAKNAPKDAVVFDVGANIGNYSLAVQKAFNSVNIHAFEPTAITFQSLQKNLESLNVVSNMLALGASNKQVDLYASKDNHALNSLVLREHSNHVWERSEMVLQTSLDSYCSQNNIAQIYLLKIDTEGYEMEVLKGATEILAKGKIKHIQFEFGGSMIDSRLFFRDFWKILTPQYNLFFMQQDGIVRILEYHEKLENFQGNNFLAVLAKSE